MTRRTRLRRPRTLRRPRPRPLPPAVGLPAPSSTLPHRRSGRSGCARGPAGRMTRPRSVDTARSALGVLALTRPATVLRLSRGEDGRDVRRVVRVLGVRYLLQATAGSTLHLRWVPAADATVDVVHALSMMGLAVRCPTHRRLACLSAAAALTFAAADLCDPPSIAGVRPSTSRITADEPHHLLPGTRSHQRRPSRRASTAGVVRPGSRPGRVCLHVWRSGAAIRASVGGRRPRAGARCVPQLGRGRAVRRHHRLHPRVKNCVPSATGRPTPAWSRVLSPPPPPPGTRPSDSAVPRTTSRQQHGHPTT